MFDPSKLDLDLENKNKNSQTSDNSINAEKNETIDENSSLSEINSNENNIDILENIDDSKWNEQEKINAENISETENDPILDIFNAPITYNNTKENSTTNQSNQENKEEPDEKIEENKVIYDINIESIKDILYLLVDNNYDFWTVEPNENNVSIIYRKDKIIKDTKIIKFPVYSNILIKTKTIAKLNIEESEKTQEWTWEISLKNKNYKIILKIVPWEFWEKIFFKLEELQKKLEKKETKKTSITQLLWFISAIALVWLIIWWSFITYIVLNAKTIEDVQFFYSLWINLNDINTFITKIISIIFSVLMFLETIFLIIFLFKFILTRKEFKQRKIKFAILSIIFFIITFSTASAWMFIDKKVKALPNWQEMAYWDIQIYDNLKLKSDFFDKAGSLILDTSNLIWPVEIKFDLDYFAQKETQNWFEIKKFIWNFWDKDIIETPNSSIIKNFDKKWIYEISLTVQEKDLKWAIIEKIVENIPTINISYLVNQNEKFTENWWKIVDFDANDLKQLWKIEWYSIENLNSPVYEWYNYHMWKAIFDETLIWMYIKNNDKDIKQEKKLDKIFIINWNEKINLNWEITSQRSIENDLQYDLKVENSSINSWNWFIEEYKWIINNKEITKKWSIENPSESSKITYTFNQYWKNNVKVILKDSTWETKELNTVIDVPKNIKLTKWLDIYNDNNLIENVQYESKLNEYYINEIWIPTKLKLDARFIKPSDIIYVVDSVSWDFDSDWDFDEKNNKLVYYDVDLEWNHTISVEYTLKHRKIDTDIVKIKEQIFIEWIKKDAVLDFEITKKDNYAPIIVSLDASRSIVKNENIVKFIWNYWDWIKEERDAIVPWHKYLTPWDYTITLKVITESWKEYETSKKLILKPKPQSVKISSSMKNTIVWQSIDFSSKESQGQITSYLWKFGDGTTSTQANPTHKYNKAWVYKVELQVDFDNNNILKDSIDIEIAEEE